MFRFRTLFLRCVGLLQLSPRVGLVVDGVWGPEDVKDIFGG